MDGICSAVFDKIKALGAYGRYFVISEEEFFEELPEGQRLGRAELAKAIKSLVADGYIDVKYSDGNLYCIAALKNLPDDPPIQTAKDKRAKNFETFWAAFAGGAAGGIVTALLCLVFLLC